MGQAASAVFSMDSTCVDGPSEQLDSQLLQIRQRLVSAIQYGSDCSGPLTDLLYLKCPLTMKYAVLNVKDILEANSQSVKSLQNIPVALNILEKYGRHLIKPKSIRNDLWRYVKYSNPIYKDRVQPLRGGKDLMKMMGYSDEVEDGLYFPEPSEPDIPKTCSMVADVVLAKKEMEMYMGGIHPQPDVIEKFIPRNVVSDVQMLRVGVSMSELSQPPTLALSPPNPPHGSSSWTSGAGGGGGEAPPVKAETESNEQSEPSTPKLCDICGENTAVRLCIKCDYKLLCSPCDDMWHRHPRRQNHQRDLMSPSQVKASPLQTSNIVKGPYGLQARKLAPTSSPSVSSGSSGGAPLSPTEKPDVTANKEQPASLSQSPSDPLKNIPMLNSLVSSSSSLIDTSDETVNNNASTKQHPPIPNRNLKPLHLEPSLAVSQASASSSHQTGNKPYQMSAVYQQAVSQNQQAVSQNRQTQEALTGKTRPSSGAHDMLGNFQQLQYLPHGQQMPQVSQQMPQVSQQMPQVSQQMPQVAQQMPLQHMPQQIQPVSSPSWHQMMQYPEGMPATTLSQQMAGLTLNRMQQAPAGRPGPLFIPSQPPEPISVYYPPAEIPGTMTLQPQSGIQPQSTAAVPRYQQQQQHQLQQQQQHQQQQPGSSLRRSQSSASKLLDKLKAEPDIEKRRSRCDINIMMLGEEIDDVEEKLNSLIEIKDNFYEEDDFLTLNRKKGMLKREMMTLERYKGELETASGTPSSPLSNNVFYPPSRADLGSFPSSGSSAAQTKNSPDQRTGYLQYLPQTLPQQRRDEVYCPPVLPKPQHTAGYAPMASKPAIQPKPIMSSKETVLESSSYPPTQGLPTKPIATVTKPESSNFHKSHVDEKLTSHSAKESMSCQSQKWQCEHCTMFNEGDARICAMCHRTSDNPTIVTGDTAIVQEEPAEESKMDEAVGPPITTTTTTTSFGKKLAQEQDQVFLEKKEAHRQYQAQLKRESEQKEQSGPSQTATKSHHTSAANGSEKTTESTSGQTRNAAATPPPPAPCHGQTSKTSTPCSAPPTRVSTPPSLHTIHSGSSSNNNSIGSGGSGELLPVKQPSFQETMGNINEQRVITKCRMDGAELLQMIKSAHRNNFDVEEVIVALEHCGQKPKAVINWLNTSWETLIDQVIATVTAKSQDLDRNDIGVISTKEAKRSLQEARGSVPQAVEMCISERQRLYAKINGDGAHAREDVLEAMCEHEGDHDRVTLHLDKMRLTPYRDRIWERWDRPGNAEALHLLPNSTCNSVSTSIITHQQFRNHVQDQQIDLERRIRMILVEARLQSWGRAEIVIKILDNDLTGMEEGNEYNYTLEDIVEAVRNCMDRKSSLVYLQKDCLICLSHFPMSKMMNLNICQCQMCRKCLGRHFEFSIKEKHVRNWTCPICGMPDFNDDSCAIDYINFLGLMLNTFVNKEIQDLFEIKVRDWHLQKDLNFRWCAHCGNGFLYQGWQGGVGQLSMNCPVCHKRTCFHCKKQWEDQHAGLTCEEFTQWKIDNDPDNQTVALARFLEESGIDCPGCNMRYSLAKGGCMHFKCPQCAHEFCSGCSQPFYKETCPKCKDGTEMGLHCHHPRDCYNYLRDNDVEQLQKLLRDGEVPFNVGQNNTLTACPVMEQKEVGSSRKDEACGKEVKENHAGFCEPHYKEYLVGLINRRKLDPVDIMTCEEVQRVISRTVHVKPKKGEKDGQTQYKKKLVAFVKKNILLHR